MQPVTDQEIRLARLIDKQYTFEEMGSELGIPARSVKAQVDRLRWKLGPGDRPLPTKRRIPSVLRELGLLP